MSFGEQLRWEMSHISAAVIFSAIYFLQIWNLRELAFQIYGPRRDGGTDSQTDRQTDRQAERQADIQQADREGRNLDDNDYSRLTDIFQDNQGKRVSVCLHPGFYWS